MKLSYAERAYLSSRIVSLTVIFLFVEMYFDRVSFLKVFSAGYPERQFFYVVYHFRYFVAVDKDDVDFRQQ